MEILEISVPRYVPDESPATASIAGLAQLEVQPLPPGIPSPALVGRPSHWSGPLVWSLLAHGAMACALAWYAVVYHLPRMHVDPGRSSIALEASFVALDHDQPGQHPADSEPLFLTFEPHETSLSEPIDPPADSASRGPSLANTIAPPPHWAKFHADVAPSSRQGPVRSMAATTPPLREPAFESRRPVFVHRIAYKQSQPATLPAESTRASIASAAMFGADTIDVPEIISNIAPRYPERALAAGLGGTVLIRVTIDIDGAVVGALLHQSSGVASLDSAAMEAIRLWRFSPTQDAADRARQVIVPIDFVIRG
ncbi:MAG: energy transducer TonB [Planctomycetales bacterium]|nr:energy transducer TonB [Planctomycetales bacterium]